MHSVMATHHPSYQQGYAIELPLDNSTQVEDFNQGVRNELTQYLRKTLRNNSITVNVFLSEAEPEQQGKLYTPQDKFNHLATKFPALVQMKQELGLDFE